MDSLLSGAAADSTTGGVSMPTVSAARCMGSDVMVDVDADASVSTAIASLVVGGGPVAANSVPSTADEAITAASSGT